MVQINVHFAQQLMILGAFLALILVVPLWLFYRRYLDLKGVRVAGLLLASLAAMFGTIAYQAHAAEPIPRGLALEFRVPVVSAGLLWVFLFPFLLRLYLSWMEGKVTEAQQRPDAEGVRAWLRGGNAVCALGVSLFAWLGFGYPPLVVLLLCVAALLAYPAAILFRQMPERFVTGNETLKTERNPLSTEREKVLAMVESGRISGEEAAELMNALGQATPNTGDRTSPLSAGQKLLLLGGVLLLIGFFLPWFSINIGEEMGRILDQRQVFHPQGFQPMTGTLHAMPSDSPAVAIHTGTVQVMGGEVAYGLGWLILLIGLGVAALPLLGIDLEPQLVRKVSLIALAFGAILILYLITQNLRFVSVGLIFVVGGYALQAWSILKTDFPKSF